MTKHRWLPVGEKAPLKQIRFEFWTYEYEQLLRWVHYTFVCAANLYYSSPIICHEICKRRFIQVRISSLVGIKCERQKGLNIIIVQFNFPSKKQRFNSYFKCVLILQMNRYFFCITFTPTAYATNDTTIIHHVYKPDFGVIVPFFHYRKLWPVCHQIGGRVRSSFLSGQWFTLLKFSSVAILVWHSTKNQILLSAFCS